MTSLGFFPFARRYLGNHSCFLFLRVLRCFSSPRSPHIPMYSVYDDAGLTAPGFPIQKSSDQNLFSSSPKLIAAYHVFHRRLAPRHPPSALTILATIHGLSALMHLYRFYSFFLTYLIVKEHCNPITNYKLRITI